MTSNWTDDEELFADLRAAVHGAAQMPADVLAAARAVFELRDLDAELARLTYDSRADAELSGAMRSDMLAVRRLIFGLGDTTLDLDVLPHSLVGQLSPPLAGQVVVEGRNGEVGRAGIDDLGMFSVARSATNEVRVRIEPDEGIGFTTAWTRI